MRSGHFSSTTNRFQERFHSCLGVHILRQERALTQRNVGVNIIGMAMTELRQQMKAGNKEQCLIRSNKHPNLKFAKEVSTILLSSDELAISIRSIYQHCLHQQSLQLKSRHIKALHHP